MVESTDKNATDVVQKVSMVEVGGQALILANFMSDSISIILEIIAVLGY